ncbi:lamin tail domain-containing protein, partial [bacterium]|nr:lamin tail domain-containing protein [bacterium]
MGSFFKPRGRDCPTPGRRRALALEPLEPRVLLDASIIITEFMADNDGVILDEDTDARDWIELHNPTAEVQSLSGWHLTDAEALPTKWPFPDVSMDPGEFLIVFASDKDRRVAGSELHTNFKLTSGGEYLALMQDDGTPASEFTPSFPPQFEGVSYGIDVTQTPVTVFTQGAAATALIPTDGILGNSWQLPGFDDSSWLSGTTGVGYENGSGYQALIGLDVKAPMLGVNETAYIRVPFDVAADTVYNSLTLR